MRLTFHLFICTQDLRGRLRVARQDRGSAPSDLIHPFFFAAERPRVRADALQQCGMTHAVN